MATLLRRGSLLNREVMRAIRNRAIATRPATDVVIDVQGRGPIARNRRQMETNARMRRQMRDMQDKIDQLAGVLDYAIEPQGPGIDQIDVLKGIGAGVQDGDLYHGGLIQTAAVSIPGNTVANTSFTLTFSADDLARLRECQLWYLQMFAPTIGGVGSLATLGQLAKTTVVGLRNGDPITPARQLPMANVTTVDTSNFPLGARLGGYEFTGTDSFTLRVDVNSPLGLTGADISSVYGVVWAGGNRDPWGGNYAGRR